LPRLRSPLALPSLASSCLTCNTTGSGAVGRGLQPEDAAVVFARSCGSPYTHKSTPWQNTGTHASRARPASEQLRVNRCHSKVLWSWRMPRSCFRRSRAWIRRECDAHRYRRHRHDERMPAIAWAKEDGLAGAQTLRAKGLAHSDAEVVDRLVDDGNGDSHDRGKPRRRLPRHRTPHRRADARGVKTRARESGNRKEGTDRSTKTWIHLETMPEGIDQALAKCGQSWPIHLKRKPVMGTSTEMMMAGPRAQHTTVGVARGQSTRTPATTGEITFGEFCALSRANSWRESEQS